jgi:nicotinate-nucleotide adenylyltransferase
LICLFGGTFDPVHRGHLHAAGVVAETLRVPQIRMLLAARPGHRDQPGASTAQRWNMLTLACREDPRLFPDDTEVCRAADIGRPSYTVETLEQLRAVHGEAVFCWVVGSDAYLGIEGWHRWRDLFRLTNLVVLRRPGAPFQPTGELAPETRARRLTAPPVKAAGGVLVIEAPMLDISATAVRQLLAGVGQSHSDADAAAVAELLPPAVYTYIKDHRLYGVISDP